MSLATRERVEPDRVVLDLHERRLALGWTRGEVARRSGGRLHADTIRTLENGLSGGTITVLRIWAEVMGCAISVTVRRAP